MSNRRKKLCCFKCHEEGHIARYCTSVRSTCSDSESSRDGQTKCSNSHKVNQRKPKCFNCQNYGHIARYCKKPEHVNNLSERNGIVSSI
ncbi:hypothetical protein B4U80_15017 [Leptotrombidium deliense]|uniref:CCHC-type domain-containing protein n=1 Tax=Leptotrombidium deliense TaxID=299467 RepID=A0A443RU28_9ACAR|nr:hypothetical protein B4U80_15017 [Leptotrombidium deliense]